MARHPTTSWPGPPRRPTRIPTGPINPIRAETGERAAQRGFVREARGAPTARGANRPVSDPAGTLPSMDPTGMSSPLGQLVIAAGLVAAILVAVLALRRRK